VNYTKGRWEAIISRKPDQAHHPQWAISGESHWIAVLGTDKYPFPNDEANAHLIAAAPDMYEALKEIAEGKGAYSMDRMTHAENTIRDMKALAEGLIDEIKEKLISQKRCASCVRYGEIGGGDWVPYGSTRAQLPIDYGCTEDLDLDDCGETIDTSFCPYYKELPRCPYHPGEYQPPWRGCGLCMEEAYWEMAEEDEDVPR